MTAVLDFPATLVPDAAALPVEGASALRSLSLTELAIALHASGAKLTRAMDKDVDLLISLAEIGLASLGVDEVRARARRALEIAFDRDKQAEYDRLFGGVRRGQLCTDFAYSLLHHSGRFSFELPAARPDRFERGPGRTFLGTKSWDGDFHEGMSFPGDIATYYQA